MIALVEPQTTKWRLRRGLSAEEVAELFDELGAPLLSWFRREVKTRDEAADLWSETWARVVASRSQDPRFDPRRARRLRLHDRAQPARRLAPPRSDRAARAPAARHRAAADGRRAPRPRRPRALKHLEGLPEDQREAVRLRVLEELDYDEIAERTGSTEPAVRQRVSRGLKWLRGRLDEEDRR